MTLLQPVHIIGAGIGGLALARCLKNKGIQCVIFEKNPSPAHHNYGISLQPWAYQLLIKALDTDESTITRRVAVDSLRGGNGRTYAANGAKSTRMSGISSPIRAHRGRLEGLLREGVDVQWGHVLQDISSTVSEYTLTFRDKPKIKSTFVVDSSGVHSQIRKSLLPNTELNVLPYVVFRGTRRIDSSTFKEIYGKSLTDANLVETKKGNVLLQISINDYVPDSETVDLSYIYSRPAKAADTLHRPSRTTGQSSDISEAFFNEVAQLSGLEQPFQDAFDEQKVREGRTLHWLIRDVLVPAGTLTDFGERGVVLIGDSAHALPILGGEGANFAVRDAVELADIIAEDSKEGLGEYFEVRHGQWEDGVNKARERLAEMHSVGKSSL